MIVNIAIVLLITIGIFEAYTFTNTNCEEDFYITAGAFYIAGFLFVSQLGGAW